MQTHVFSMRDSNDNSYHSVVTAPDERTARRLFAREMLEAREATLLDEVEKTLDEYASERAMDENWLAGPGSCCPSCSSHDVKVLDAFAMAAKGISPVTHGGRAHGCASCAFIWIDIGYDQEKRDQMEVEARRLIDGLDEYEAASVEGERA